jgi:DNA-binding CsgD family transcriptional regulator/PAS domain-containing protein
MVATASVRRSAPLLDSVIDQVYEDLAEVRPPSVCADMLREQLDAKYVGVQMLVGRTRDRFTYILRSGFEPSPKVNQKIVSLSNRAARGSMWSIDLPPCGAQPSAVELAQQLSSNTLEGELRDYYAKIGIGHTLLATCYMDDDWRYLFFASRPADRPAFGARERQTLAEIAPHLRTAFRARTRFLTVKAMNGCLQAALEQLAIGVLILGRDTDVLAMNAVAERILVQRDGLSLGRGLSASLPRENEELHRLIRQVAQPGSRGAAAMSVWRPSGRPPLEMLVEAIRTPAGGAPSGGVVVYLRDRETAPPPAPDALQDLFRLTEAEANVAARLAEGMSPPAICDQAGISHNTLRAHLRSIYAKCAVENQVELLRLILNSPACLAASGWERGAPLDA